MCYIEFDLCEVWDEREITKARKTHKCDCCRGIIDKGCKYWRHFSKFEGEITSEKICLACQHDREVFAKAHENMRPCPSATKEMVHECLHEREDFKQMLQWARMLRRMDNRAA